VGGERLYRWWLGGWFGGEIKKRLDRGNEGGKETRVIRFRKKALLEDNVSEMRTAAWEPDGSPTVRPRQGF
jgi:hypothetical protein